MGLPIIIKIFLKLRKPGTSKELKNLIICRYVLVYIAFLPQFFTFIEMYTIDNPLDDMLFFYFLIFIPIARLSEPLILESIKDSLPCKKSFK